MLESHCEQGPAAARAADGCIKTESTAGRGGGSCRKGADEKDGKGVISEDFDTFCHMWQPSRKVFRFAVTTSVGTGSCLV